MKPYELRQTLVAFSNTLDEHQAAVLFIGVDDKTGTILGIDNPGKIQKRRGSGRGFLLAHPAAMAVLHVSAGACSRLRSSTARTGSISSDAPMSAPARAA